MEKTGADRKLRHVAQWGVGQMTRVFAAPRHLVFDAFTKSELVRQWLLGPEGWTMPVCDIDLRVGGGYRYVWRTQNATQRE